MSKIHIEMDDVVAVTQSLASVIQRKGLSPDEFKTVRKSWENLMDSVAKLQRNAIVNKLYPENPPEEPASDVSIPQSESLPSDESVVKGEQAE